MRNNEVKETIMKKEIMKCTKLKEEKEWIKMNEWVRRRKNESQEKGKRRKNEETYMIKKIKIMYEEREKK